jgi:hypothetical protein
MKHTRRIALERWQLELVRQDPRPLIRGIFTDALDLLGIAWRQSNPRNISIARREAVAALDAFVGPKR